MFYHPECKLFLHLFHSGFEHDYEIYPGCEIIVDYESQNNLDIIDHFNEASNFEGYAALNSIDYDDGIFTIKGMELDPLSLEYLIVLNQVTNEYEHIKLD